MLDGLDLALPPEATVRGRLRAEGVSDWTGAAVSLVNDDRSVEVSAASEPDGAFRVVGLHGGVYTAQVSGGGAVYLSLIHI